MEKLLAAEAALAGWKKFSENIRQQVSELINLLEKQTEIQEYISNPESEDLLLSELEFINALQDQIQYQISELTQQISKTEQSTRNSFKVAISINSENIPVTDLVNSKIFEVIQDINRVLLVRSSTFRSSLLCKNTNLIENSLKIDLKEERHLHSALLKAKLAFQMQLTEKEISTFIR